MEWYYYLIILIGIFIIFRYIIFPRKKGSLLEQSQSRIKNLGSCCMKSLRKLFGGA